MKQREIKFRGKRIDNRKWEYGSCLIIEKYHFIVPFLSIVKDLENHKEAINYARFIFVDSKTIGQYTGLKNNQGIKIYKGDIVNEGFDDLFEIEMGSAGKDLDNEPECWIGIPINNDSDIFSLSPNQAKELEVIGNIYENKELIK